jgi:hypothetical protein
MNALLARLNIMPFCRSSSQKCEYLMNIYQRKRVSAAALFYGRCTSCSALFVCVVTE